MLRFYLHFLRLSESFDFTDSTDSTVLKNSLSSSSSSSVSQFISLIFTAECFSLVFLLGKLIFVSFFVFCLTIPVFSFFSCSFSPSSFSLSDRFISVYFFFGIPGGTTEAALLNVFLPLGDAPFFFFDLLTTIGSVFSLGVGDPEISYTIVTVDVLLGRPGVIGGDFTKRFFRSLIYYSKCAIYL